MFGKLTSNKGGFIHENDKRYLWKNGKQASPPSTFVKIP